MGASFITRMEQCPLCFKQFPSPLLERHVNSCLDGQEHVLASPEPEDKKRGFAAFGLKADRKKDAKRRKTPSLTSILIAERRLKRRQEQLEETETEVKEEADAKEEVVKEKAEVKEEVVEVDETAIDESEEYEEQPPAQEEKPRMSEALRRNQEFTRLKREAALPLAQRLRPRTLDDFFGQEKLVGENGVLRNIINADQIPSFILWGVPGVGKTSLARIIATTSSYRFIEVSGVNGNAKQLREAFATAENEKHLTGRKTILFLDEIHRFNKAVQDTLLPAIERGTVTVIGATTENPSFSLNNALLSRMHTFVMDPLPTSALVKILNRGLLVLNRTRHLVHKLCLIALSKDAIDYIAEMSTGDSRVALNILESLNAYLLGLKFQQLQPSEDENAVAGQVAANVGVVKLSVDTLKPILSTKNYHQMYDRQGENHYDAISAFHKSVRGSNADAALFYLAKMLSGGEDPLFIARRCIVIASEDIGLRDSLMLPFAIAALEAIKFVGMPEGRIILAHLTVKLARSPKSTKSYRALNSAMALLKERPEVTKMPIPLHLRNAPTGLMKELGYGDLYKYNPNYEHGRVHQLYFPAELGDVRFLEDQHLGTLRDDDVDNEDYEKLAKEDAEYREYKRLKRQRNEDRRKLQRVESKAHNVPDDSDTEVPEHFHSYDEFLSKEDQPEYFDGREKDEYSDDPDCVHNFEYSYDEMAHELQGSQRYAEVPLQ